MSTEYNISEPTDGRVGNIRIANTSHSLIGIVFVVAGLTVLLKSLPSLRESGLGPEFGRLLGVALLLLLVGAQNFALSMRYWGFRFSDSDIGQPGSKADAGAARNYLTTLMKDGIKEGDSLPGAIGGLLAWVTPRLHMAPAPIRQHAFVQALRTLNLAVILGGFLLAWVMADSAVFPYMAAAFFVIAVAVVRPQETVARISSGSTAATPVEQGVPSPSINRTITLLVFAMLAPTGLTILASQDMLPAAWPILKVLAAPTLAILVPALCGSVLYFLALSRQTRGLTKSKVVWSGDDGYRAADRTDGLLVHLARQIPDPKVQHLWAFNATDGEEGKLSGHFIYETEPKLVASGAGSVAETFQRAWADRTTRPLVILELLGVLLGLAGCASLLMFSANGNYGTAAMALGLLASSHFCMISAHKLWKRADFESLVYEVETDAQFKRIDRTQGNINIGGGSYRDKAINVTSGRLLVRVARMHSVSFAPKEPRFAMSVDMDVKECDQLVAAAHAYRDTVVERTNIFEAEQAGRQHAHSPALAGGHIPHQIQMPAPRTETLDRQQAADST